MIFAEMNLKPEILGALQDLKFGKATPIQSQVIPRLLTTRRDLVALAQTGTGKTAAFGVPLVQQVDPAGVGAQALILCPTRELCIQIARDISKFAARLKGVSVVPVYGGESIGNQLRALRGRPQIVVGTPGRTLDLIKRKKLSVGEIRWFVMDEADEMLNMGFKEELDAILKETPAGKQNLLFSATIPRNVERLAKKYMTDAERIAVKKEETGGQIEHHFYFAQARDRYAALRRILDFNPGIYGIIFCRTKHETKEIADNLSRDHYSAEPIHGDLTQAQRDSAMGRFRRRATQILVATDVAARGIDVSDLTHVINFNLPQQAETYVHRSGRTGRAGNSGISLSIIGANETGRIRTLERIAGKPFKQKKIPLGKEICERQLSYLLEKIGSAELDEQQAAPFLDAAFKQLESLSREDLIKRLLAKELQRFLSFYKGAGDLNESAKRGGGGRQPAPGRKFSTRRQQTSFSKFKIETGSANRLLPRGLIDLINRNSQLRRVEIGKIEIRKNHSFFEIESGYEKVVLDAIGKTRFNGSRMQVSLA